MQRVLIFILISIAVFGLPSCTKGQNPPVQPQETAAGEAAGQTAPAAVEAEKAVPSAVATEKTRTVVPAAALEKKTEKAVSEKPAESFAPAESSPPVEKKTAVKVTAEPRDLKATEVGQIVYVQGTARIIRNRVAIEDVDIGTGIENFDLVETSAGATMEILLSTGKSSGGSVTISENTSFTIDINTIDSRQATTFELLAGSIAVKADKLASQKDLNIQTDTAMMGVRGTEFAVTAVPNGDVLVTCRTGSVACREAEKTLYAKPGQVVEKTGSADLYSKGVAVTELDKYTDDWFDEKVRLLKANALAQITQNALEYEKRIQEFNSAYANLAAETAILDKWYAEDKAGKIGTTVELMQEKKKIIGHLFAIRKSLFWLERVYFRLLRLKTYHDQGIGVGSIRAGLSTTAFFNTLLSSGFKQKLAIVLYVHKLYVKRNDGSLPLDDFDLSSADAFDKKEGGVKGLTGGKDFFKD